VKAIDRAIITLSNMTVRVRRKRTAPEHLLLLLPHCIQNSECDQRLGIDMATCKRCGKCQVKDMLEIAEHYGIRSVMATGGELALKKVKDKSVHAVVAVACEKELREGILSCFPKAVLAVTNERPYGPCKDTCVVLDDVRQAIEWFLEIKEEE